MATRNGGPAAPSMKELDALRDLVQDPEGELTTKVLDRIDAVLEYVQVMLQNRKEYHQRRNIKMKTELELLKGRLMDNGINPDEIAREAAEKADREFLND